MKLARATTAATPRAKRPPTSTAASSPAIDPNTNVPAAAPTPSGSISRTGTTGKSTSTTERSAGRSRSAAMWSVGT